jgi:hypothetical protein
MQHGKKGDEFAVVLAGDGELVRALVALEHWGSEHLL